MSPARKLRIAVIANANLPVPPYHGYGGTQRGVYDFLTELDRRGHALTLYAPLSSQVRHLENVELRGILTHGLWEPGCPYPRESKAALNERYLDFVIDDVAARSYDVVNFRSDDPPLLKRLVSSAGAARLVYSLHNVKSMATLEPILEQRIQCVSHCANHRAQYGDLENIRVIMYGINTEDYPFSSAGLLASAEEPSLPLLRQLRARGQDYLITLGSIRREKGQRTAIELARRVGLPLVIAGTPERRNTDTFFDYFRRYVVPEVDDRTVFYFGNADEEVKKELLRFASGFVFPSGFEDRRWEEPFGRAPVEALACGTPVVAFAHGSMREIIEPGVNGFLFQTRDEATEQLRRLRQIDRATARWTAVTRFDKRRVAAEYEQLFFDMLSAGGINPEPCLTGEPRTRHRLTS